MITPHRGLLPVDATVNLKEFSKFGQVQIDEDEPRYRRPLVRDSSRLLAAFGPSCEVVLLGSVATGKYLDIFWRCWGEHLRFPSEFVGRGDMSRGGLMLRCAATGSELNYIPVAGAVRHGKRPPKLDKATRISLRASWPLCGVSKAMPPSGNRPG